MQYLAVGRIASDPGRAPRLARGLGLVVVLLTRTTFGRAVYAIGNRERAAYLSGINTNRMILAAFMLCGMAAGLAGVLLAGYSNKAYQGMGDAYLLPAIAAVVIGGTNILGGRGRYLGTFIGVILIVLLNSVLSIMQMPEAGRQIIYGVRHHRHAARLRPWGQGICIEGSDPKPSGSAIHRLCWASDRGLTRHRADEDKRRRESVGALATNRQAVPEASQRVVAIKLRFWSFTPSRQYKSSKVGRSGGLQQGC